MFQSNIFKRKCLLKERTKVVYSFVQPATLSPTNYVYILIIHFARCIITAWINILTLHKSHMEEARVDDWMYKAVDGGVIRFFKP